MAAISVMPRMADGWRLRWRASQGSASGGAAAM